MSDRPPPLDERAAREQRHLNQQRIEALKAERTREALTMRIAGASLATIAAKYGVDISRVSRWISKAIASIPQESAEQLRTLELARLDRLELATDADIRAMGPDDYQRRNAAVALKLRIGERRAKLAGLDREAARDVNLHFDARKLTDAELQQVVREAAGPEPALPSAEDESE